MIEEVLPEIVDIVLEQLDRLLSALWDILGPEIRSRVQLW